MWEFLKSNARKERERIDKEVATELELEKKLEEERVEALYLIENKRLNDKLKSESDKYTKKETKRVKDENEICPKCKSTKVVDKISRLKGEINGSSHSYGYGLFGGGSYGSGSIHGSVDTLEINKCNHCTNEWKKVSFNRYGTPSWEAKMRYLKYSIENLIGKPLEKEHSYVKEVRNFWSGTKLDIMYLFIERTYFGYLFSFDDDYKKKEIINLIKNHEDILINKLGFIK